VRRTRWDVGLQLNDTVASLHAMILRIREAASNLTSATAEILAATTQQLAGPASSRQLSRRRRRRWTRCG